MAKHFGAAESDIKNENFGTINLLTQLAGGGARGKEIALAAIAGAKSLSPEPEKVDAAQLAIRFFSQMGANAAQPGSTALSAAASALPQATGTDWINEECRICLCADSQEGTNFYG